MTEPAGTQRETVRGCVNREELLQVVDLLDRAFENTPREYFERHVLHDPTLSPEDTRILLRDGRIVSSVQIFPRIMRVAGASIPFGGIGNVATDPSERKSGLASTVMHEAIARMRQRFPFSMLTTTINRYYERFGYRTVVREQGILAPISGSMSAGVRRFRMDTDLARVKELYRTYTEQSVGPVVRDDLYWEGQFAFCGEDTEKFLVLERDGTIRGYIRARVYKEYLEILEYAAGEDLPAVFDLLLRAVAGMTPPMPIKLYLSEIERARLQLKHRLEIKEDTDLMCVVFDERYAETIERQVMQRNGVNFWSSDFF